MPAGFLTTIQQTTSQHYDNADESTGDIQHKYYLCTTFCLCFIPVLHLKFKMLVNYYILTL